MVRLCQLLWRFGLLLGGLLLAPQALATSDATVVVYHPTDECDLLYDIYQANINGPNQYSIIDLSEGNVHGNVFEYDRDCSHYWELYCNSDLADGPDVCYADPSFGVYNEGSQNALPEIFRPMTIANGRIQRSTATPSTPALPSRIMSIVQKTSEIAPIVSVYKLSIENGYAIPPAPPMSLDIALNDLITVDDGGGISVSGNGTVLNIESSIISNNTASGNGGGIGVQSGSTCNVQTSLISQNTADAGDGGGIFFASGSILSTMESSTISDNATTGSGGGVASEGNGLSLFNSTIAFNNASASSVLNSAQGGGLVNSSGYLLMSQCTVFKNVSDASVSVNSGGGGIAIFQSSSSLMNNTITGNSCNSCASPVDGVFYSFSTANLLISNIIAENGSIDFFSVSSSFTNPSFNLIGNCDDCNPPLVNGQNFNIIGLAPGFLNGGQLTWNGGPTQTVALGISSPALNAGSNTSNPNALLFDQRGPDFFRVVGARPDIGAYEVQYDF